MVLHKKILRKAIIIIASIVLIFLKVEVISWAVLAYWGIRLAIHMLKKEAERRVVYVYR